MTDAAFAHPIPPPPRRPLAQRGIDVLLWGGILLVLLASFEPVQLSRITRAFTHSENMRDYGAAPDLVIGTMFLVAVGPGPVAGVMALAINTGGVLAKLFSEAVEAIDPRPVEGVRATGATPLQEIVWGVAPQVAPLWTSYGLYRFESNARSATVLGLIGAGGIGQTLFDALNSFNYSAVSAIALIIVIAVSLIDLLSQAMRRRLI